MAYCMNCIHYEKCKKEYAVIYGELATYLYAGNCERFEKNNNIPPDCSIGLFQSGDYSFLSTMLDILKGRLPKGLTVASVKETNTKYKITFDYQGDRATAELSKVCAPNSHKKNADNAIITAMSSIMLNRGDLSTAKEWLNKLGLKEENQDTKEKSCENCLHYNACRTVFANFYSKVISRKTENCPNFIDKNKFAIQPKKP